MKYLKCLSQQDLISLLTICNEALRANNLYQFQSCFHKLKSMICFDGAFSVYADKKNIDRYNPPNTFYQTLDISNEFLDIYINNRHYENSIVCQTIFKTWQPLHWKTAWAMDFKGNGHKSKKLAMDFGYLDGWTCANYHKSNACLSIFTFTGRKAENDARTTAILQYLTPHLAEALKSIFNPNLKKRNATQNMKITPKALEILKWIAKGKSRWDISIILNTSEKKINQHVNFLTQKLGAQNETHAVAIAMRYGFIE